MNPRDPDERPHLARIQAEAQALVTGLFAQVSIPPSATQNTLSTVAQ